MNGIRIDYEKVNMKLRPSKHCTGCRNGHYHSWPGNLYEPPEEDFRCDREDVIPEEYFEQGDMDVWPEACGHFTPFMIGKCAVCGQTMDVPEYLWPFTHHCYGEGAAGPCSPACLVVLDAYEEKEQRDMREAERRYMEAPHE